MTVTSLLNPVPRGPLDELTQAVIGAHSRHDGERMCVTVDGRLVEAGETAAGRAAAIHKTNDKTLADALSRVDVDVIHLYECRATDLSPLARHARITGLSLNWLTKVTDLDWILGLPNLRALSLVDLSKLHDLGPISSLPSLRGFALAGSMTSDMKIDSLAPLSALNALEELSLMSLRVMDPQGLRPLARCNDLRHLHLPNVFETADYAYLAARLPRATCKKFAAYETLLHPMSGKDVLVTGKRKPFLNSVTDATRLARYVSAFEALKAEFAEGVG